MVASDVIILIPCPLKRMRRPSKVAWTKNLERPIRAKVKRSSHPLREFCAIWIIPSPISRASSRGTMALRDNSSRSNADEEDEKPPVAEIKTFPSNWVKSNSA